VDDRDLIESRFELSRIAALVSPRELALLVKIGSGDSCRDIATNESLPIGTVKTRLRRCRAKLAA
jgi:DNA-binding NarL/FixJ family response regulator